MQIKYKVILYITDDCVNDDPTKPGPIPEDVLKQALFTAEVPAGVKIKVLDFRRLDG